MKTALLLLCLILLLSGIALADVPPVISYQGRLMDDRGMPLPDNRYEMMVTLFASATSSTPMWGPVVYSVETRNSLFNLSIGGEPPLTPDLFRRETWIEIRVNERLMTPRSRIHCVGYAFRAAEADTAVSLSLPFSGVSGTAGNVFLIRNTGGGRAGVFENTATTSTFAALRGYTTGLGAAGEFEVNNTSNSSYALRGVTNGRGAAVSAESTGSAVALSATTSGLNPAATFTVTNAANENPVLRATTSGGGRAGEFTVNNTAAASPALYATTNGAGGAAVQGLNTGRGSAGYFEVNNTSSNSAAIYVYNNGNSPSIQVTNSGNGSAGQFWVSSSGNTQPSLIASTNGTGYAAVFGSNNSATARAAVSVSGAGTGGGIAIDGASGIAVDARSMGNLPTIKAIANGTGEPVHLEVAYPGSGSSALYAASIGTSPTLNISNSGTGEAGHFEVTNSSSGSSAIYARTTGTAATVNVKAGKGKAAYFDGDVEITGKATGPFFPIAYGSVNYDGSKKGGSANFSSTYVYTDRDAYRITIDGVYVTDAYTIICSPQSWDTTPFAFASSGGVMVYLTHAGGGTFRGSFSLVVYGP